MLRLAVAAGLGAVVGWIARLGRPTLDGKPIPQQWWDDGLDDDLHPM